MQPRLARSNQPATALTRMEQAKRLRERFDWLNRFSDEELQQISFCETGAEMVPGETYFDISHPEKGAFVGQQGQLIPEGGCLVRKASVSNEVWNKLTSYP
ncbi:MAG TPA: hypothetical protein VKX96_11985 [Chloroflexota bacterium]|jgi:hypothetical protein|nr:hypothetical protein [Chloroflexota bacterium]